MSHTEQIQQLLAQKPGLKAQQIADELRLERSQVAAALHGLTGGEVSQDSAPLVAESAGGTLAR